MSESNIGEKARWSPPPTELLDEALNNAKTLLRDSGGCIDSISFGIAWKSKFPSFSRDRFHGTQITSFNKLLKDFGNGDIIVKPTDKKEVNMYLLKEYEGYPGAFTGHSSMMSEQAAQEGLEEPRAQVPWNMAGGRAITHPVKVHLPAHLAAFSSLDDLLGALEPSLVAIDGGVSSIAGKDAVAALHHVKRLGPQATYAVQRRRQSSAGWRSWRWRAWGR